MYCIALLHVFCLARQVKLLSSDLDSVFLTVAIQMLHNCFQLEDNLTDSIMAYIYFQTRLESGVSGIVS